MTTILDQLFTTDDRGAFEGYIADDLADALGASVDEADAFIESLVALGILVEEDGETFKADERDEWLREEAVREAEEREDWEQYLTDRRMGYALACC